MGAAKVTAITDDWHAVERLAAEIERADHRFLLVECGTEIVATGSSHLDRDVVTVQRLYVRPRDQGVGHGAALLDALVIGLGTPARVELNVGIHNTRAIAFYERHGFVNAGRADDEHFAMRREV